MRDLSRKNLSMRDLTMRDLSRKNLSMRDLSRRNNFGQRAPSLGIQVMLG